MYWSVSEVIVKSTPIDVIDFAVRFVIMNEAAKSWAGITVGVIWGKVALKSASKAGSVFEITRTKDSGVSGLGLALE
jgi:hypothetical protein